MSKYVRHPTLAAKRAKKFAGPSRMTDGDSAPQPAQMPSAELGRAGRAFWQGPLGPIEALLPDGVDAKRLRQMPASYRRSYIRTVQGKASPKTAIRMFCLECVRWQRALAVTCPTRACPLWAMLPRRVEAPTP
jgi:hypothetical protein